MRPGTGRSALVALVVTALAVVLLYLASTLGYAAWRQSLTPGDPGIQALPSTVENAPPSIGTTAQYGPLGPVSMVYAGTAVEDGLVGDVDRPWVAVAAGTGDYRAVVAPGLPAAQPGAVAIDDAGSRLAWATGDGVVVYDTATDTSRTVDLPGTSRVGTFSPDGALLSVHAGGLAVVELSSGEVVTEASGTDPAVVRNAAWRGDASALDYVVADDLVTLPVDGSPTTTQPSPFAEGVPMAWSPSGELLVALQADDEGVVGLAAAEADPRGRLGATRTVDTTGVSVDALLGFSGDGTVAVSAYLLETGRLERVLDIELDGGAPVDVAVLPSPGENWRSSATLAVSGQALRSGSADFGGQARPWSYRSRLAACTLVGLFGLGLWLTRRRRRRRWRRS